MANSLNVPARSAYFTGSPNPTVIYSDFLLDFSKNPVTGFLGELINEAAVSQMMQCLVLVEQGEWPFEPQNGSTVSRSLFEPSDQISITNMSTSIADSITNYAPQVNIMAIQVVPDSLVPSADAIMVNVFYQIANIPGTFVAVLPILRRLR